MNLYIDKEFLDDFYADFDEKTCSSEQQIIYDLLTKYPDTTWFINYKISSEEDILRLKNENPLFAAKANYYPPIPVDSLKEELDKSNFDQEIVFMRNEENWFKDVEKKGAICFSFENYQPKLKEIIKNHHFKIDLSEDFKSWDRISSFLAFNRIILNDNYILTNKTGQLLDKNLIPLFKNLLIDREGVNVKILTKDLNHKVKTKENMLKEAEQRLKLLYRNFADFKCKFRIINNDYNGGLGYDFHDRMICFNFHIIESGKGFNLIPHKTSNSQITSETIFDLYTYKRMKNLNRNFEKYFEKIKASDSPYHFTSIG